MVVTSPITVPTSENIRWRWTGPPRNAENPCDYTLIPTEEFAIDLGSFFFLCVKKTVPCLWPITDVFQLKIRQAEVQSCFVRVR